MGLRGVEPRTSRLSGRFIRTQLRFRSLTQPPFTNTLLGNPRFKNIVRMSTNILRIRMDTTTATIRGTTQLVNLRRFAFRFKPAARLGPLIGAHWNIGGPSSVIPYFAPIAAT